MTGQHARRYSRIREWRTGWESYSPKHRKRSISEAFQPFVDFVRAARA